MTHPNLATLDARDREYVERTTDPQVRAAMLASLTQYRRTTPLKVGDAAPDLSLTRLADDRAVRLHELVSAQPLMLIFGSVT